jgi:plasmid stability protein
MATLTVRKFDDALYARLGERARQNRRSLEAEARVILDRALAQPEPFDLDAWQARVRQRRENIHARFGPTPDSVALVRAVRDEG